MRNPYAVLGVSRSASGDEIKAAFRKHAKSSHPDRNQDNPDAASHFSDINIAYEILGDEKKRRLFDTGQIDAAGRATARKSVFSGFSGVKPWAGFGFKRQKPERAQSADENVKEAEPEAGGFQNETHEDVMERIFGESFVRTTAADAPGLDDHPEPEPDETYPDLRAEIMISLESALKTSSQKAVLPDGRTVDVNLPAGIEDGRTLRLHGKGKTFPDGKTGDALITIRYKKHKYLRAEGVNLVMDLPVPLKDGILGTKLPVDGLDGRLLVTVPPWSGSDRVLRIRGKGLPDCNHRRGDLFVNVKLLLPDSPDENLVAFANS
ncbi:DnaJ C-terminal domain-containing protein [Hoeflea sp. TYP-13]|uniref:DnaJ C-terminal domain-containing protein n=1 Tax=Hoeflea sp. TYP-13 TaxID=3230023 RepID=UPI0034C5B7B0